MTVDVGQGIGQVAAHGRHPHRVHGLASISRQSRSLDELKDEVRPELGGADIEHGHKVRMVEAGQGSCLCHESLVLIGVRGNVTNDPDGDVTLKELVLSPVHVGHPPTSR